MRTVPVCLLLAALTGCASDPFSNPETGLVIAATAPTFHPGDTVTVEITNRTSIMLGENLCPFNLQRQQEAKWKTVYSQPGPTEACPMVMSPLPPGASVQTSLLLPRTLSAGRYRVVFVLIVPNDRPGQLPEEDRASTPFAVGL